MSIARRILPHLSLLLFVAYLQAQQNGNMPRIVQDSGDFESVITPMKNGDWLVINKCAEWPTSSTTSCTSCTDSNGIVPTITVGPTAQNNVCTGNGFDPVCTNQQFWGQATSNGTPSISCSCSFPRQNLTKYMEISGSLTFDADGTASTSSTPAGVSVTSTAINDAVVTNTCETPPAQGAGTPVLMPDPSQVFGGTDGAFDILSMGAFFNGGAAGTLTGNWIGGLVHGVALSAVAFKPSSLVVGTTALPQGGKGTAYEAQLVSYGGTSLTPTWSITAGSLPTGLSLTGSTGVISGTPTATGTPTITFKSTDGTNSGTASLSVNIASSLQTIGTPQCTGFTTNPNGSSLFAQAGDTLLIAFKGEDRHGNHGYLESPSNWTDSFSDTYYRSDYPMAGGQAGALPIYSTTASASGIVSPNFDSLGGSPLAGMFCDIRGSQQIMDAPVVKQAYPGAVSSFNVTNSISTNVPNNVILAFQTMDCLASGGGSCTMTATCNSPFVQVATVTGFGGVPFTVCEESAPTATSYSLTSNYTDSTNSNMVGDTPLQAMVTLRPTVPGNAPTAGEKQRRRVY